MLIQAHITERLSALKMATVLAWPVQVALRKKIKVLWANSRIAIQHPHLFDDEFQQARLGQIAAIVAGKTVAVVGNAQYLLETSTGAEIDRHEVVVRFNKGFVIAPESQGSRTTIHCLATDVSVAELRKHAPQATIVYVSPIRCFLNRDMRRLENQCICVPINQWKELSRRMGNLRPSAGLIILDHLLHNCSAKKVSLFGFDWKRTKTFYHKVKIRDWHSGEAERALVLDWAAKHPSVMHFGNCPMGSPE